MGSSSAQRAVTLERNGAGQFTITNSRGGQITIGDADDDAFTPTELLLAAIGGCTAIDVDTVTSRRSAPDSFQVRVDATKVRDADGNRLADIEVTFRVAFPATTHGDDARAVLPDIVKKSHDRLCTVSRTIEVGTPIANRIEHLT